MEAPQRCGEKNCSRGGRFIFGQQSSLYLESIFNSRPASKHALGWPAWQVLCLLFHTDGEAARRSLDLGSDNRSSSSGGAESNTNTSVASARTVGRASPILPVVAVCWLGQLMNWRALRAIFKSLVRHKQQQQQQHQRRRPRLRRAKASKPRKLGGSRESCAGDNTHRLQADGESNTSRRVARKHSTALLLRRPISLRAGLYLVLPGAYLDAEPSAAGCKSRSGIWRSRCFCDVRCAMCDGRRRRRQAKVRASLLTAQMRSKEPPESFVFIL